MIRHVVVASPKGGVGRTLLVAQLATRFTERGVRCLAVDLDPQNALALQLTGSPTLGVLASWPARGQVRALGIVDPELSAQTLAEYLHSRRASVAHVPFGAHSRLTRRRAEETLAGDSRRLRSRIASLVPPRCDIVLIDTPAGQNQWAESALALAEVVLVPLLAEPACLATVPGYELYLRASAPHAYPARTLYAVNRLNPAQEVSCDALHVLRESLPGRVLDPAILDDEYLREALARGEPHAPAEGSQGAADFEELAEQVLALLAEPQTVSASRSKAPPHVVR